MRSSGAQCRRMNASCSRGGFPSSSGNCSAGHRMNPAFFDLLRAFAAAEVRFLVVGAYALAHHGRPRATGDLDLWVDPTPENSGRVMRALSIFGAPLQDISESDFARPGVVFQIGVPPARVDVLTDLTGINFAEAWPGREAGRSIPL
jgi:hypothetical protein